MRSVKSRRDELRKHAVNNGRTDTLKLLDDVDALGRMLARVVVVGKYQPLPPELIEEARELLVEGQR